MKKILNYIKKRRISIIAFFLGLLITTTTYAATIVLQSRNVEYDYTDSEFKDSNGNNVDNVQTAIDELYSSFDNSSGCQKGYTKIYIEDNKYECGNIETAKSITLKVGDVVKMTPTLNSFSIDKTYTGSSTQQTIKPKLLNTWRVIRVNSNGTYDAVSEYISYETISFAGGGYDKYTISSEIAKSINTYVNYIYYLNLLASKYENSNFTVGSRHMGYNGQSEKLTDIYANAGTEWRGSTSESTISDEPLGRGDLGYKTDLDLVKIAYGGNSNSPQAYKVNASGNPTTTTGNYYLASRSYYWNGEDMYSFLARYINSSGNLSTHGLRSYTDTNGWFGGGMGDSLRPIIVLKSDLTATGLGTLEYPYVLQ